MNATLQYGGREVTFYDCDPADCVEAYLLQGHWYELGVLQFLQGLQVGGTYVDAGAYVGTFSVFADLFCPCERLFGFEPQKQAYDKLFRNLLENDRPTDEMPKWHVFQTALADWVGRGSMVGGLPNLGASTLRPGTDVAVATLDSIGIKSEITVLKIDVESSELAVLRGAAATLKTVRHLFIETWPEATCKIHGRVFVADQVAELLTAAGFVYGRDFGGDTHHWRRNNA
jgi:FkbM family methyltransferase